MFSSLRIGITGLRSHQTRMDVIGNNIANVNTAGFKRGRVAFHEILGQSLLGAGRTAAGPNGVANGHGATVAGMSQEWTQGSFEYTNIATDLALAGDGFFLVEDQAGPMLTRAGAFGFDADGYLIASGGQRVQGWAAGPDGSISTGALDDLRIDLDAIAEPQESGTVTIAGNLSAEAQPGDDPVTISTVVYDAQGEEHSLVLTLEPTAEDEWTVTSAELAGDPPTALAGGGTVTFNDDGTLDTPLNLTLTGTFPNGTDDVDLTLDLEGLTQFGGSTTAVVTDQNGRAAGEIVGYGIDPEGQLLLSFSNGEERAVGQLAIGTVANADGLVPVGDSFLRSSAASGDLVIGRAGQEVGTSVVAGALEMSNVDLATEFTDMIVTQRGYQASARVITTSDELLQEVVQLKR